MSERGFALSAQEVTLIKSILGEFSKMHKSITVRIENEVSAEGSGFQSQVRFTLEWKPRTESVWLDKNRVDISEQVVSLARKIRLVNYKLKLQRDPPIEFRPSMTVMNGTELFISKM